MERLRWFLSHGEASHLSRRIGRTLQSESLSWVPDPSYAGEWPAVRALLTRRLDPAASVMVDIGASDGLTGSVTLPLLRSGWRGLLLESSPSQFASLAMHHQRFPGMHMGLAVVTTRNVAGLLKAFEVPQRFGFLNIDIDSLDRDVVLALLQAGYRPDVISMEVNEKVPPPIYFSIRADCTRSLPIDHVYGCSLTAAASATRPFGYVLAELAYNNALFAHASVFGPNIVDLPEITAYEVGYTKARDRVRLFPWNRNVDHWRYLTPEDALIVIQEYVSDRGLTDEVDLWIEGNSGSA